MRKLIFIVIFIFIGINLDAQKSINGYELNTKIADSLFQVRDYCKAAKYYNLALNKNHGYSYDYQVFLASISRAKCGNLDSALNHLYKLI